jgi:hypothetical protein
VIFNSENLRFVIASDRRECGNLVAHAWPLQSYGVASSTTV